MTNNSPQVSVIIPTYNHAAYIGQAVESVLAQTYRDFEILVIDDGSTDNTKEVLQPYMDKIRYMYQTNSGESQARNRGIQEARGEYIALLDADDLWAPNRLKRQVPLLEAHPEVGLVYSDAYRIDEDGTILERALETLDANERHYLNGYIFPYLLCWHVINTQTVLVRKTCFKRVGLFDETLAGGEFQCEDLDMWLRITNQYPVVFVDKPLAYSRFHGTNQSSNLDRSARSQILILNRLLESREWPDNVRSVFPLAFSNVFYHSARDYYVIGKMREARREILNAIRYTPFRWQAYSLFLKTLLGRRVASKLKPLRDFLVKFKPSAL